MKFNSQICTTKEQSERLLALGLKKETADMYYSHDKSEEIYAIRACWEDFWDSKKLIDGYIRRQSIPAWSLHRLVQMMPFSIMLPNYHQIVYTKRCVFFERDNDMHCSFNDCDSLYDNLINCIKWLIKEGHFNKEYLEECAATMREHRAYKHKLHKEGKI